MKYADETQDEGSNSGTIGANSRWAELDGFDQGSGKADAEGPSSNQGDGHRAIHVLVASRALAVRPVVSGLRYNLLAGRLSRDQGEIRV